MVSVEDSGGIAFGGGHRSGVVEQLSQLFDRIAHVGTQHIFAEKLVEHLAHGALQEGHAAGVAGAVPGIRAVAGVVAPTRERREEPGHRCRLAPREDMPSHELRRILKHVNEAVQFTQDIVGNVAAGPRFAIQENGNVVVLESESLE